MGTDAMAIGNKPFRYRLSCGGVTCNGPLDGTKTRYRDRVCAAGPRQVPKGLPRFLELRRATGVPRKTGTPAPLTQPRAG